MTPPRGTKGLTLSQLAELGRLVRVRCNYCRSGSRHYYPADLLTLLGDREVDSLRRRLRCEGCGRRDYVEVEGPHLSAGERTSLRVRRLVRISTIRRAVWREEGL